MSVFAKKRAFGRYSTLGYHRPGSKFRFSATQRSRS